MHIPEQENSQEKEKSFLPDEPRRRGRPRGSIGIKSKIARAIADEMNVDPLRFLLSVVKNKRHPLPIRVQAAIHAGPFIHPKLSTQNVALRVDAKIEQERKITAAVRDNLTIAAEAERLFFMLEELEPALFGLPTVPKTIDVEPIRLLPEPNKSE